ncbi:unnamed protein product [Dracunculus medinensis]|uniref:Reverse transcriptase domain-containing protein n=1 Tax=Dracunculus medinensis TaxID=318479 RepID=A0A0N4U2G4_DRAME|nr:unnamed protein product [Dracunculus medinensis]
MVSRGRCSTGAVRPPRCCGVVGYNGEQGTVLDWCGVSFHQGVVVLWVIMVSRGRCSTGAVRPPRCCGVVGYNGMSSSDESDSSTSLITYFPAIVYNQKSQLSQAEEAVGSMLLDQKKKVSSASRRQALSTVGSNRKLSVTIENNHSGGSELVKSRENTIKKPIIDKIKKKGDLAILKKSLGTMIDNDSKVTGEQFSNYDSKLNKLQATVDDLAQQILSLSEMVKKLINMHLSVDVDEIKFGDKKCSSAVNEQSIFLSSLLAEKENLPVQNDLAAKKWDFIRRRLEQDEDFRRYVDEGIMQFGGDPSLEIIDKMISNNYKTRNNIPSSRHNQECPEEDSPSSIFKTMKVIKKTTVKQTQRDEAPVFANPFSYEMKKYLEKYGVIQTSAQFGKCNEKRTEPSLNFHELSYNPMRKLGIGSKNGPKEWRRIIHDIDEKKSKRNYQVGEYDSEDLLYHTVYSDFEDYD